MTEFLHCDLPECEKTHRTDGPSVLPDPWLKVEPLDGGSYLTWSTHHYCSAEHAAEHLARKAE